jgi:hypothetical protein
MRIPRLREASVGTAFALLALWPRDLSRATPTELPASEQLVARGAPGHSVEHALLTWREIAAEHARGAGGRGGAPQGDARARGALKNLLLPGGASVRRELRAAALQFSRRSASRVACPPRVSWRFSTTDVSFRPTRRAPSVPTTWHDAQLGTPRPRPIGQGPRHNELLVFWAKVAGGLFVSDPRIEYDPLATGGS